MNDYCVSSLPYTYTYKVKIIWNCWNVNDNTKNMRRFKYMRRFDLIELTHDIDVPPVLQRRHHSGLLLVIEWINYGVLARTNIKHMLWWHDHPRVILSKDHFIVLLLVGFFLLLDNARCEDTTIILCSSCLLSAVMTMDADMRGLLAGSSFGYCILYKFWFSPIDAIQYVSI